MATDWYATRLLIAVPLIGVVLAFPLAAGARGTSPLSRSRHVLRALGYRDLHISCRRGPRCSWRGVRRGRGCSGQTVALGRRRRRVRVESVRCSGPVAASAPLLFGFNAYITPMTVAEERTVGGTIARLFVPWWRVEPAQGSWDWGEFDREYQEILQGGLRPLIVADGAPCWAEVNCSLTFASPPTAGHDEQWSAYVRQLAERYPQAVAVEVWNEPNLASSFYPQVDPARYTQLLQAAYAAVKAVDPAMPVISGGLAMSDGSGFAGAGYASRTFLADMYADGARRFMDGLAIHVYPTDTLSDGTRVWDPAAMPRWLKQIADVGEAAGVKHVPIWITEMGVSTTTEPGFPPAATTAQQAADLMGMIAAARSDRDVRMALIDTLQDADPNLGEDLLSDLAGPLLNYDIFYNQVIEGLGVFYNDWKPKPAACELSAAFAGSLRC